MQRPAYHLTAQELVSELGEALYGRHWRRALAHELDLSPTQVSRWSRGAHVTDLMRSVLRIWARRELPLEAARAVRRVELLGALAALPTTKED